MTNYLQGRYSPRLIKGMTYHELCGAIDCLPDGHPDLDAMQAEAERRRAINPAQRHYAEAMR